MRLQTGTLGSGGAGGSALTGGAGDYGGGGGGGGSSYAEPSATSVSMQQGVRSEMGLRAPQVEGHDATARGRRVDVSPRGSRPRVVQRVVEEVRTEGSIRRTESALRGPGAKAPVGWRELHGQSVEIPSKRVSTRRDGGPVRPVDAAIRDRQGWIRGDDGSIRPDLLRFRRLDASIRGRHGRFRGRQETIRGRQGRLRGDDGSIRRDLVRFRPLDVSIRGRQGRFRGRQETIRGRQGGLRGDDGSIRGDNGAIRRDLVRFRPLDASIHGRRGRFRGRQETIGDRQGRFLGRQARIRGTCAGFDGRLGGLRRTSPRLRSVDVASRSTESSAPGTRAHPLVVSPRIRATDRDVRRQLTASSTPLPSLRGANLRLSPDKAPVVRSK